MSSASVVGTLGCFTHPAYQQRRSLHEIKPILQRTFYIWNANKGEKRAEVETTKKAVKAIQSKVEKTTLGDLGALADLKAKLTSDEAGAKASDEVKGE